MSSIPTPVLVGTLVAAAIALPWLFRRTVEPDLRRPILQGAAIGTGIALVPYLAITTLIGALT